MQEMFVAPLHVGSHVLVHGLVCKTMLNNRPGFVVRVGLEEDRWGVVMMELDCEPGLRKIWNIKPSNLKALVSYKGLKVTPVGDSNVTSTKIEPFDFGRSFGQVYIYNYHHVINNKRFYIIMMTFLIGECGNDFCRQQTELD